MRRYIRFSGVRATRGLRAPSVRPSLEILEDRLLPSIDLLAGFAGIAVPGVELVASNAASPNGNPGQPSGLSPQQVRQAYSFNQIAFNNGAVAGNGYGQTIAIVDAYNQPYISSDLQAFDSAYGLPAPPNFVVVNQNGGASLPAANQGWGLEESLDVEWAHAIAPGANILLVEANSANYSDLLAAVNYARIQPGVSVVSMSWGSGEFPTESFYDSYFTTPAGHEGVTFVASSGDSGTAEFPSISPNVLAVGGTQLNVTSAGNYGSETAWNGSGGGISTTETQPSYQKGVVSQTSAYRAVPDVAYNASSASAFSIFDSYGYSGWLEAYGTSAGAPQWAALIAVANQGRALAGKGTLDGGSQTLPTIYNLPQSDFHDITSGSNGRYSAGPGYDLVTGRGSPVANLIVAGLIGQTNTANPPWVSTPANASSSSVAGTTTNLSVRGGDNYNSSALTYSWSVIGAPSGATGPTFSANGSNTAQNTTITFHNAGAYILQVTITNIYGLSATSDVSVSVNQTLSGLSLTPANGSVYNGASLQFTATALDQFGHAMSTQPNWTWSLTGGGSLQDSGQYTAPANGSGTVTVYVNGDGLWQSATVTYSASPPTNPEQTWSIWLRFLESWLSQFSQFQSLWQLLLSSLPAQNEGSHNFAEASSFPDAHTRRR